MSEEIPAEETVAEGTATPPEETPRRRLGRVGFWARLALAGLVGFAIVAVAVLSQTGAGQRMVLDEILGRARGALAGELRVGGIRSQTLLAGFTLTEVRLDAEGGQPVLQADSLVVRYSLLSLLVGSPRVRSSTLHGLELEISRRPEEDALNIQNILLEGTPSDTAPPGRPSTIELGRISVREGTITVLTPADAPSRMTVAGPDGSPMRRLAFEDLDLDIEETVLRPGGAVAFDARLAAFNATVHIVEEPLVVRAAVGDLTFGAEGLLVQDGTFRLPGSLLGGQLVFGPERPGNPWAFAAELRSEGWGDLADLQWIDSRIPEGAFRGGAGVRTDDGLLLDLRDFEVQAGASAVTADGGVRFGDVMTLSQLVVTASPLAVADAGPWVERDLPLDGFLSGQATLSGTWSSLHIDGRMTLVPTGMGGTPTTADLSGTVFTGRNPGAEGLEVRLDPLNYRILEPFWPDAAVLGEGRGELEVDGRAEGGVLVVADFLHLSNEAPASRVFGQALLTRTDAGVWVTDARGDVAPFALDLVGRFRPDLDLQGVVAGPVRVQGTLDDLRFEGNLAAGGGRLVVSGSVDAARLGAAYALSAEAEAVNLTAFTTRLPEPSVVSGNLTVQGSGMALDSLEGIGSVTMRPSRIGPVRVVSAASEVRATGGLLLLDSMEVDISGARVAGSGTIGMVPAAVGEATFAFAIDSLGSFRPMFMGDSILVGDGLSPLEADLMRIRGIDPDTLPTELDVRMTGSASGSATVQGHLGDMGVQLGFEATDLAYRHNAVDSARATLVASGLPEIRGDWAANVRAHGITWETRTFEEVAFEGTMSQRRGEGILNVVRRLGERYYATGSFALDSVGGQVALAEGSVQIDELSWVLAGPSRIAWDTTSVQVDSLELRRLGDDPSSVTAQGTLTRGGESNFRLEMEGFHVEEATRILQREDLDVSGHVDLSLTVLGPAESPRMDALFQVEDPRYGALRLSRLSGSVEYRDRSSELRVDAWDGDRNVLSAVGTLPLDLALIEVERRSLDEPMDVRVSADSLDARIALAYFGTLEDVEGTISADLRIGGTSREPEPSGTIRLADGAWTISALGVRHTGLAGELELRRDRTVGVQFGTTRAGRSTVSGVVTMIPFSNPTLDLLVTLDEFQAVNRPDIESMLSGSFTVRGEYRLPVAEGSLRVDQGTLFVDEFARNAAVVDLRDPSLFQDGFAVDTTVFVTQPILASLRNPFLDNLRVDIDLSVPRNLWLRSNEMNVEIGGDLIVRYDRAVNDLVMVGDLQALRGSYRVLGRTFEVDGGTVSFLGQPGVNPSLGIQAISRVRRRGGDRLEVRATVSGTLVQPVVTLSTTEAGLSQSDLVSYLLFGVAGGEFGTGGTTAGGGVGQDVRAGTLTYLGGAVGSQLGTALAQEIGFDYFAISQGEALAGQAVTTSFLNTLSAAQVEVGRYFGDDVFVVLVVSRPNAPAGASSGGLENYIRGIRVELALSEEWFVEGFREDRFLRGSGALGQTGLDGEEVLGFLIFRDWGYGSQE